MREKEKERELSECLLLPGDVYAEKTKKVNKNKKKKKKKKDTRMEKKRKEVGKWVRERRNGGQKSLSGAQKKCDTID